MLCSYDLLQTIRAYRGTSRHLDITASAEDSGVGANHCEKPCHSLTHYNHASKPCTLCSTAQTQTGAIRDTIYPICTTEQMQFLGCCLACQAPAECCIRKSTVQTGQRDAPDAALAVRRGVDEAALQAGRRLRDQPLLHRQLDRKALV